MALNLDINSSDVNGSFKRIANDLMNEYVLVAGSKRYRLTEIEFYLKSRWHDDPYSHGHPRQLENNRWYFHGSGLDLTFGDGNNYGGILIRAIYDLAAGEYFYGPIVSVAELFGNLGSLEKSDFQFGLEPSKLDEKQKEKPIAAPRVGLNPNHNHLESEKYHKAYYRYLIMPKRKHGEKTKIAEAMSEQGYGQDEINNIWG